MRPGALVDDRFLVVRRAAAGGYGVVYRAMDLEREEDVALKLLWLDSDAARTRFEREASALQGLRHPNVVRHRAHAELPRGRAYVATEWLGGITLEERLREGEIDLHTILSLGVHVAEALGAAHAHGIVHRDVKPANVMFTGSGLSRTVLIDFGLARGRDATVTATGVVLGTPGYMAPEQARASAVQPQTDVFGLGAVLYRCVAGAPPFGSAQPAVALARVLMGRLRPLSECAPDLPPHVIEVIEGMLSPDPEDRPVDGAAAATRLRESLAALGGSAPARTELRAMVLAESGPSQPPGEHEEVGAGLLAEELTGRDPAELAVRAAHRALELRERRPDARVLVMASSRAATVRADAHALLSGAGPGIGLDPAMARLLGHGFLVGTDAAGPELLGRAQLEIDDGMIPLHPLSDRAVLVVERSTRRRLVVKEIRTSHEARAAYLTRDDVPGYARHELHGDRLAREHVPGFGLAELAASQPSAGACARVVHALILALQSMHEAGLAHGNLSPSNVRVRPDETVLLVDPWSLTVCAGSQPTRAEDWQAVATLVRAMATPEAPDWLSALSHEISSRPPLDPAARARLQLYLLKRGMVGDAPVLGDLLGAGGMGLVHRAYDPMLRRHVAVKVLRDDRGSNEARFLAEARATAQLEHPGVVPVHGGGRLDDGRPYYVMKEVRGETLEIRLEREDLTRQDHLLTFERVCEAIAAAHRDGLVHRDIKPANIMVGDFGETLLLDWGLVQRTEPGAGAEPAASGGEIAGTPAYMAPEQARGESVGPTADVYSLGVVLYRILTGRALREAPTTHELVALAAAGEALPLEFPAEDVSPELVAICRTCLSPDPRDRFPHGAALRGLLGRALRREQAYLASHALRRRADHALATLEAAFASGDGDPSTVAGLFGAARLAYEQALDQWPTNEQAREGRERVSELASDWSRRAGSEVAERGQGHETASHLLRDAQVRNERILAWVRAGSGVVSVALTFVLSPSLLVQLLGLAYGGLQLGGSAWQLWRLSRPGSIRGTLAFGAFLDTLLCFYFSVGTFFFVPLDFEGLPRFGPFWGIPIALTVSGLRLSTRLVVLQAGLTAVGAVGLAIGDSQRYAGNAATIPDWFMFSFFVVTSTLIALAIAHRTRRLVMRAARRTVEADTTRRLFADSGPMPSRAAKETAS